jgi:hypothetical protein
MHGVHSSKVRLKYDNAYQVTSSLAKGYDPSALLKMSTADRNPWLAKMIK